MILIALGANLPSFAGPPADTLQAALAVLEQNGIKLLRVSRFYTSDAWPNPADPPFVNAVAQVETVFSPELLLDRLHEIERCFGRVRGQRNAPRTLDLDILDYDGRMQHAPVELPHPRMESRAFVLLPLRDVAPEWRHPASRKTVAEMIAANRNIEHVSPLTNLPG